MTAGGRSTVSSSPPMSDRTAIEWADASWNPVRGCTRISPGCAHCYAETFAERFRGVAGHPYEQGFDLRLVPGKLAEPLRWPRPRMVFVNSMSDLFHRDVPDAYIRRVVDVMLAGRLAHLSGPDQAFGAAPRPAGRPAARRGGGRAHLVGRQRRGPPLRPAAGRAPPARAGRRPVPVGRAPAGGPRADRPRRDRLGDRRRRERPRGPADGPGLGPYRSATAAPPRASPSSSSSGAAPARARPAGCSTAGRTTRSRPGRPGRSRASATAGPGSPPSRPPAADAAPARKRSKSST